MWNLLLGYFLLLTHTHAHMLHPQCTRQISVGMFTNIAVRFTHVLYWIRMIQLRAQPQASKARNGTKSWHDRDHFYQKKTMNKLHGIH